MDFVSPRAQTLKTAEFCFNFSTYNFLVHY